MICNDSHTHSCCPCDERNTVVCSGLKQSPPAVIWLYRRSVVYTDPQGPYNAPTTGLNKVWEIKVLHTHVWDVSRQDGSEGSYAKYVSLCVHDTDLIYRGMLPAANTYTLGTLLYGTYSCTYIRTYICREVYNIICTYIHNTYVHLYSPVIAQP